MLFPSLSIKTFYLHQLNILYCRHEERIGESKNDMLMERFIWYRGIIYNLT